MSSPLRMSAPGIAVPSCLTLECTPLASGMSDGGSDVEYSMCRHLVRSFLVNKVVPCTKRAGRLDRSCFFFFDKQILCADASLLVVSCGSHKICTVRWRGFFSVMWVLITEAQALSWGSGRGLTSRPRST